MKLATTGRADWRGLWVPVITPFTADDQVDHVALARVAARLLADGATGIVALGTTGEPATLAPAEQREVVETCAAVCRAHGRPLIIGCGTNSTRATIAAVQAWADVLPAISAFLVVVPYYTRPSEAAVVEHFRVVAGESPMPVIIYNVPYRTGRGLGADALVELAAVPNIAGVKQAIGTLDGDTLRVLGRCRDGFAVLAGDDAFITPSILMGASGAIAAAAHACTPAFARMIAAALEGAVDEARIIAHALLPVVDAGFSEPSPSVWKAALHALGEIGTPALRLPMTPASDGATRAVLAAIRTAASSMTRPSVARM